MSESGFIKLHRQMTDWEWYRDNNTKIVFLHILLTANFKHLTWKGVPLHPGQVVTSINNLSKECNLSVHQIRRALDNLKTTHEITIKTASKYSVITVVKWRNFQAFEKKTASKTAGSAALKRQQDKNDKNNIYNIYNNSQSVNYIKYIMDKSNVDDLLTSDDDRRLYKKALEFLCNKKSMQTDIGILNQQQIRKRLDKIDEEIVAYVFDSVKTERVISPVPYIAKSIINELCKKGD